MKPKRKYRRGAQLHSMFDVVRAIEMGRYLYLRDKPIHPGFLEGMSYHTLRCLVAGRSLYDALETRCDSNQLMALDQT